MDLFTKVGIAAAALLGLGWLVVSFLSPGRRRSVIEWLSATALYVMLFAIVFSGARRAWAADRKVLIAALGFLCFLFSSGAVVSLVMAGRELGSGGRKPSGADPTH